MNKGIITLLLFGLFAGTVFAQEAAEKKPKKKLFKKKNQVVEEVTSPLQAPKIQEKPAPKAQPTTKLLMVKRKHMYFRLPTKASRH